jgi:hypothetical protein
VSHEERERVASKVGLGLVGAFFALRSLENEYAGMVLQVWDEEVAGDNVCISPPDATRPRPTPGRRPGLYARHWRYFRRGPTNKDRAMGRPASQRAPALAAATKQRARLAAAQAHLAEIKAAKLRGELVEAAAVEAEWSGVLRTVRAGMTESTLRWRPAKCKDAVHVFAQRGVNDAQI